jgi:CheY-like chemotaxis protein
MRLRRFLLAHPSLTIRAIVKQYILSEFTDVAITVASDAQEALQLLRQQEFDLVLTAGKFPDFTGPQLIAEGLANAAERRSSVLVITSEAAEGGSRAFHAVGVSHFLTPPFSKEELCQKLHQVLNPRALRVHGRFYTPQTQVLFHIPDAAEALPADLINLSLGGFFCEMPFRVPPREFYEEVIASIHVSLDAHQWQIDDLSCRLARLQLMAGPGTSLQEYLRLTFQMSDLSQAQRTRLQDALRFFENQTSDLEQQLRTA